MTEFDFLTGLFGGGLIGGLIGFLFGAILKSLSTFLLEGLRERKREREELINLARNRKQNCKPDRFRHAKLKGADLHGAALGGDEDHCGADFFLLI